MAFLGFTHGLCYLSYLERRESTSAEASGMSASGNLAEVRSGEEAAYRETLDYPTRLAVAASGQPFLRISAAGGIGESDLPAGIREDTQGRERGTSRRNVRKCHLQPRGEEGNPQESGSRACARSQPWPPRSGLRPRSRQHLGAARTGRGRRRECGSRANGSSRARGLGPRASPSPARGPRAGMRGAGTRWRVGGRVARERAAEGGSSKRVTARESGKSPRSPWRRADQWQQRKLFMGAERRHSSRRSLWSGYLMPVLGPLSLREAPSGGGVTRGASGALELKAESRGGWEKLLPEPSFGPGCALSQVRDGKGWGPREGRSSVPARSPICP